VLARAVKAGLGPGFGGERFEGGDQLGGALPEGDEPDTDLIELGEVLLGGVRFHEINHGGGDPSPAEVEERHWDKAVLEGLLVRSADGSDSRLATR
jgi:hypothetical protein